MNHLQKLLTLLKNNISKQAEVNQSVSQVNVGWHIEHSLMVVEGVLDQLEKSKPEEYKWQFNLLRTAILVLGKIPKGKGKAPKVVKPVSYSEASLQEHVRNVEKKVAKAKTIDSNSFFKHPYFGNLKKKKSIRFLEIHTQHHIDIIESILKK